MSFQAPKHQRTETVPHLRFYWSGCRDLNSGPSVPQIDAPQTTDLRKRPETASCLLL